MFVTCVHRKVVLDVEGWWVSSTGCVVHVVVYGEWVAIRWQAWSASVICRRCGVQGGCWVCVACWSGLCVL